MDPFRDELAAAHERIARLERENAELRARAQGGVHGAAPAPNARLVVAAAVALMMLFGMAASWVLLRRAAVAPVQVTEGIAIAPVPASAPPMLTAAPETRATAAATATSTSACRCAPGDPLCSCAPPRLAP